MFSHAIQARHPRSPLFRKVGGRSGHRCYRCRVLGLRKDVADRASSASRPLSWLRAAPAHRQRDAMLKLRVWLGDDVERGQGVQSQGARVPRRWPMAAPTNRMRFRSLRGRYRERSRLIAQAFQPNRCTSTCASRRAASLSLTAPISLRSIPQSPHSKSVRQNPRSKRPRLYRLTGRGLSGGPSGRYCADRRATGRGALGSVSADV